MGDINEVDWVAPALRATPTQKYYLLQYMEARPHLAQKEFGTAAGRKDGRKEWETLSETLNNLPGASIKTCDQWIKYWDDQRTAVRGRAARVRNHLAATGGGRPLDLLTDYDRRVLALDGGWLRVAGFTSVVDPLEIANPLAPGGGVASSSRGFPPRSRGFSPSNRGLAPSSRGLGPSSRVLAPSSRVLAPNSGGFSRGFAPRSRGFAPSSRGFAPSRGNAPTLELTPGLDDNGWEIIPAHLLTSHNCNVPPRNRNIPEQAPTNIQPNCQRPSDHDGWETVPPQILNIDDDGWETVPDHILSGNNHASVQDEFQCDINNNDENMPPKEFPSPVSKRSRTMFSKILQPVGVQDEFQFDINNNNENMPPKEFPSPVSKRSRTMLSKILQPVGAVTASPSGHRLGTASSVTTSSVTTSSVVTTSSLPRHSTVPPTNISPLAAAPSSAQDAILKIARTIIPSVSTVTAPAVRRLGTTSSVTTSSVSTSSVTTSSVATSSVTTSSLPRHSTVPPTNISPLAAAPTSAQDAILKIAKTIVPSVGTVTAPAVRRLGTTSSVTTSNLPGHNGTKIIILKHFSGHKLHSAVSASSASQGLATKFTGPITVPATNILPLAAPSSAQDGFLKPPGVILPYVGAVTAAASQGLATKFSGPSTVPKKATNILPLAAPSSAQDRTLKPPGIILPYVGAVTASASQGLATKFSGPSTVPATNILPLAAPSSAQDRTLKPPGTILPYVGAVTASASQGLATKFSGPSTVPATNILPLAAPSSAQDGILNPPGTIIPSVGAVTASSSSQRLGTTSTVTISSVPESSAAPSSNEHPVGANVLFPPNKAKRAAPTSSQINVQKQARESLLVSRSGRQVKPKSRYSP